MSERYIIYNGSKPSHCCFKATVMDSTRPEIIGGEHYEDEGGKHYETVCECFEMSEAVRIAKALNDLEK